MATPQNENDFIIHNVKDLYNLPDPTQIVTPKAHHTFSYGDTHGNAMALIRYLYQSGLISLKTYKTQDTKVEINDFDRLRAIYDKDVDALEIRDINNFQSIMSNCFEQSLDLPGEVILRFFGDMLADRGKNDIFSLIILDELKTRFGENIKINILLSNHDIEFIKNYVNGSLLGNDQLDLNCKPVTSLKNFKKLLTRLRAENPNLITEVDRMIQAVYLPSLSLVEYKDYGDKIDIMTHAPLSYQAIKKAVDYFLPALSHNLALIKENKEDLKAVLTALNMATKAQLQKSGRYEFSEFMLDVISGKSKDECLTGFIWQRLPEIEQLGTQQFSYIIRFRHGHDGTPGPKTIHEVTYIGYNNDFGKKPTRYCEQSYTESCASSDSDDDSLSTSTSASTSIKSGAALLDDDDDGNSETLSEVAAAVQTPMKQDNTVTGTGTSVLTVSPAIDVKFVTRTTAQTNPEEQSEVASTLGSLLTAGQKMAVDEVNVTHVTHPSLPTPGEFFTRNSSCKLEKRASDSTEDPEPAAKRLCYFPYFDDSQQAPAQHCVTSLSGSEPILSLFPAMSDNLPKTGTAAQTDTPAIPSPDNERLKQTSQSESPPVVR